MSLCIVDTGTFWKWQKLTQMGSQDNVNKLGLSQTNYSGGLAYIQRNQANAMATHSSTLAWKIPWTEEPGRLQSMGSLRVEHVWVTSLSRIGEGNGNSLQCSCLENPRDGIACWAAVYGVAQSWTRLKQLSSSSSSRRYDFGLHRC